MEIGAWASARRWKTLVQSMGVIVKDTMTQHGNVNYKVFGTADTPTVFVDDASGLTGELIEVHLGGESTDTDVGLGRDLSERIY